VKLSRFAALGFIAALVACNPTLPPPPPGWSLELRAGTTNIDSSFFQSTKPDATRSSEDQTRFEQLREAIIKKVPNLNLGSAVASGFVTNPKATKTSTRETAAFSLSLFMAVSKDGAPPASDLSFIYSGPKGTNDKPVVYPAGKAWIASVFTAPKGNGDYTFSSTLQDGTLAGNVSVNFDDQTQWLPFAMAASNPNVFAASMGQYANVFIANWQAVPEAQSYIGLVFDRTDKKYVGSFLTTGTRVETQEFNGVQEHTYSLDLIATNIDLTKDDTKPYGTLPVTMKSSISSFFLNSFGGTPGLSLNQTRVNFLAKPNQMGDTILKIKNLGISPLGYTATISGTGLELGTGASGILLNEESRELHVKGMCTGADLTGTITITSNDPNNKTKTVPVTLECDMPVTATLELAKLSHNSNVQLMQYSPDGTKLATSDSRDIIIWNSLTGNAIRKFSPIKDLYNESISGISWNPNGNLLAIGGMNSVKIFDTNTGLSTITVSPSGSIQSIDWDKDGSQFVIGLIAAIQIYDSANGGLIRRIEIPGSGNYCCNSVAVSWSKSSAKLATVNGDRVTVWDAETGIEINHYVGVFQNLISSSSVSWNPTGDTLAFRTPDGLNIAIWSVENANLDRTIPVEPQNSIIPGSLESAGDVKWSPVGLKVALIARKTTISNTSTLLVRTWDASNGNFQIEFPIRDTGYQVFSRVLDWSFDGKSVVTLAGASATSWNTETGNQSVQFGFVQGRISSIHFDTNGLQLLAASNSNYVNSDFVGILNLMEIPNGTILQNYSIPKQITSVDWRKDSAQIMVAFETGGIVRTYTPGSWNPLSIYEGYTPAIYSPDGTKIAVSVNDLKIKILDALTGAVLQTLTTCNGCSISSKQSFVWSPDSTKLGVAGESSGSTLSIYNAQDGSLIWEKNAGVSPIFGDYLLWSPDGKRISAGSLFFDAVTGNSVEVFGVSPEGQIPTPLAWSPDSRYLLTKTSGLIELRNANTGRKVLSVTEFPSQGYGMMSPKVIAQWNAQNNRFAFTDGQSNIYIYKFSQP
jgi:WD40 repeat protein